MIITTEERILYFFMYFRPLTITSVASVVFYLLQTFPTSCNRTSLGDTTDPSTSCLSSKLEHMFLCPGIID